MKVLLTLLCCLTLINVKAQTIKKTIPPFNIQLTNQQKFSYKNIEKNKPLMLVYFQPNCEHCQLFTVDFLSSLSKFKSTQIVFITYQSLNEVVKYQQTFNMASFTNIKMGTEGYTFLVQKFYNIQKFPFVVLFDKNGNYISSYRDKPEINELLKKLDIH